MYGEENGIGEFVATVIGVIDPVTRAAFEQQCRDLGRQIDVFDLRFVSLISAAGVSALLSVTGRRRCRVIASRIVERVFDMLDMSAVFDVVIPSQNPQMDNAPFGVAVHDSSLRFMYVNRAMGVINGADEKGHVDQVPDELFDDESDLADVRAVLLDVLGTGRGRDVVVAGTTPATSAGTWNCRVRQGRYQCGVVTETVVIAMVDPIGRSDVASTLGISLFIAS